MMMMAPGSIRSWSRLQALLLVVLGLSLFPGWAEAGRDLNLAQCINQALAHDPETQNAKRKVEIGRLKRSKAVHDFLPKFDLYLTTGPQTDYFGRPVTDKSVYYEGVSLEQPLFKGGTLVNGVRLAESETRKQEFLYLSRKLAVAAETIKAYYQTLSAQVVIQQYEALLRHGEQDLQEAKARLAAGTATRMEVLDFSVKLLDVQQKLAKARSGYQVQLSALKKIVGIEEESGLVLLKEYPLRDIQGDLEALLKEAQGARPDLKSGREEVTYNQVKTNIEKGKRLPQLSIVGRYEWENPVFMEGRKDWLVLLKASISFGNTTMSYSEQRIEQYPNIYAYPTDIFNPLTPLRTYAFSVRQLKYSIFDRSSNKVELEEARAERDLAQGRWEQLQRQVYYEVRDALAQKQDGAARMETAQKQVTLARELLEITRTKYAVGYVTLTDVFKARATLAEAEVNLITAQNDKFVALGKLYQALGRDLQL
jgi:outer membrane protein TolC